MSCTRAYSALSLAAVSADVNAADLEPLAERGLEEVHVAEQLLQIGLERGEVGGGHAFQLRAQLRQVREIALQLGEDHGA